MKKRSMLVFAMLSLLFVVAALRFYSISTSQTYSAQQAYSSISLDITTSRGMIYDCNMLPLVNKEYEYIAAVPPTAAGIAAVKDYDLSDYQQKRLSTGYPVLVTVNKNFKSDYVKVYRVKKRYSEDTLAAHIIGYIDSEGNGVSGIEKSYNDLLLSGKTTVYFKTDAKGNVLSGIAPEVDEADSDCGGVALTIDRKIQQIAEDAANKYLEKGAVVVLENATGKIRAMVSVPDYSPLNVASSLNSDKSPFINRAITGYNSGSVFKLCIASAALENNISLDYNCNSYTYIGNIKFSCLKTHGKVEMKSAIALSCNTYFINLGQKVGANLIYNMCRSFSFGMSNTLCKDIVSSAGNLPSLKALKNNPAALANFSFGQGDLLTTPLQIASMIQCIANDGKLIKPTLIEEITDSDGNITESYETPAPTYVLKTSTAQKLQEYMISTVEQGTGVSAAPESGGAGGKTATAETGWFDNDREVVQAWFAGFFPAEKPKYTIVVLAEDGITGGQSAAPVFKQIADNVNNINNLSD